MTSDLTDIIKIRASILAGIRKYFNDAGYTEADVPLLSPALIPEAPIELFRTELVSPYAPPRSLYLLPSPEYYLKQLIARGSGDIYCLSRSFRNSEQQGSLHNPEFMMLEWYTMNADCYDSIETTEDFIDNLLSSATVGTDPASVKRLKPPFIRMSMTEAFDRFASFDLSRHCTGEMQEAEERAELRKLAGTMGLTTSETDSWEELFNLIFVHQIEPALPQDKPLVICDYPAGIPALAKPAAAQGRLERWELYAGGIELANCYTEETGYETIKRFFDAETADKKDALVPVATDYGWCEMYRKPFPACSGTALGVDRLMMMLSGSKSIEGVILFPFSDILREPNQ